MIPAMVVFTVVYMAVLLVISIVSLVSDMKRIKEMKSMTLELFEKRLIELKKSRNGAKFVRFMRDNSVFIQEHETEAAEILARVFPRSADSNTK